MGRRFTGGDGRILLLLLLLLRKGVLQFSWHSGSFNSDTVQFCICLTATVKQIESDHQELSALLNAGSIFIQPRRTHKYNITSGCNSSEKQNAHISPSKTCY
jgi:hypothetical protein